MLFKKQALTFILNLLGNSCKLLLAHLISRVYKQRPTKVDIFCPSVIRVKTQLAQPVPCELWFVRCLLMAVYVDGTVAFASRWQGIRNI